MTERLTTNSTDIQRAGAALKAGELVAFPTETVYGLGANALDAEAVNGIFRAKERPASDPLIIHVHSLAQVPPLVKTFPPQAQQLAQTFWAGALTMILPKSELVPSVVSAGLDTVALRMPSHPVALALLKAANVPVAAPSANRFSRPSPTQASHVLADLDGRIAYVVDGGATTIGLESTVLELTQSPAVILRPGAVTREMLLPFLPDVVLHQRFLQADDAPKSPGMLAKHYSPRAALTYFKGEHAAQQLYEAAQVYQQAGQRVGVMISAVDASRLKELPTETWILAEDDNTIARDLFRAFRDLDARSVDVILVAYHARGGGLSLAIADRLSRAAEGDVVG